MMSARKNNQKIKRPILFNILIATPISVLVLLWFFFNLGAATYAILALLSWFLIRYIYFRYFNK